MKDWREGNLHSRTNGLLTNIDFVICLCVAYAFKLELLQGLGEFLDSSRKIWKIKKALK